MACGGGCLVTLTPYGEARRFHSASEWMVPRTDPATRLDLHLLQPAFTRNLLAEERLERWKPKYVQPRWSPHAGITVVAKTGEALAIADLDAAVQLSPGVGDQYHFQYALDAAGISQTGFITTFTVGGYVFKLAEHESGVEVALFGEGKVIGEPRRLQHGDTGRCAQPFACTASGTFGGADGRKIYLWRVL